MESSFLVACGKYDSATRTVRPSLGNAKELLAAQPDLIDAFDEDGWTCLHHAAGEGHSTIVEWLCESTPVVIDAQDSTKCTPLWCAAFNNRRDVVKTLLLSGADEQLKGQPEGEPCSSPALAARRNRHPGLGDLLDAESALRSADPTRRARQLRKEMSIEEFNESMRASLKQTEPF
jgi:ankyrin repeat protein